MERENAKIARKIKAGERERICDLTKYGEKHDPRMIAYRAQVATEKEAAKAQKTAAADAEKAKLQEEARAKAEVEEAARLVAEEKKQAERKVKDDQKNVVKGARQRVRNLHKNAAPVLRRAVHMDQLQAVCLELGAQELSKLAEQLEAALAKQSEDCGEAIKLLHGEIRKLEITPIEDDSVQLKPEVDSESTVTPEESGDEEEAAHEPEMSPEKIISEPSLEELAAARAQAEAEQAEEQAAREKKAEEQRKKREQKKREDEKKASSLVKAEAAQRAKLRKAEEKASSKEQEKVTEETASPKVQRKPANTGIAKNVILVVTEEGPVFASLKSDDEISTMTEGSFLVAAGSPVDVDGYDMVPLQPCGSIELRIVRLMVPLEVSSTAPVVREEAPAAPKDSHLADVKQASKAAKQQAEEEDLDGLLSEFGVVLSPVTKSSKKKGKH